MIYKPPYAMVKSDFSSYPGYIGYLRWEGNWCIQQVTSPRDNKLVARYAQGKRKPFEEAWEGRRGLRYRGEGKT